MLVFMKDISIWRISCVTYNHLQSTPILELYTSPRTSTVENILLGVLWRDYRHCGNCSFISRRWTIKTLSFETTSQEKLLSYRILDTICAIFLLAIILNVEFDLRMLVFQDHFYNSRARVTTVLWYALRGKHCSSIVTFLIIF